MRDRKRVYDIYLRLIEGKMIFVKEEVERFHVSERTIRRDMAEIREFFFSNEDNYKRYRLIYDKKKNGFQIIKVEENGKKN